MKLVKIGRRHMLAMRVLFLHTIGEFERIKGLSGMSKWMAMRPMTIAQFTEEFNKMAEKAFIKPIALNKRTGQPLQAEVSRIWEALRKAGLLMPLPEQRGKRRTASSPILTPVGEQYVMDNLLSDDTSQWSLNVVFENGELIEEVGKLRMSKRG